MNWKNKCLEIKIWKKTYNKTYNTNLRNQGTIIAFWIYEALLQEIYTNNLNKKNCILELISPNPLYGQFEHWVLLVFIKNWNEY